MNALMARLLAPLLKVAGAYCVVAWVLSFAALIPTRPEFGAVNFPLEVIKSFLVQFAIFHLLFALLGVLPRWRQSVPWTFRLCSFAFAVWSLTQVSRFLLRSPLIHPAPASNGAGADRLRILYANCLFGRIAAEKVLASAPDGPPDLIGLVEAPLLVSESLRSKYPYVVSFGGRFTVEEYQIYSRFPILEILPLKTTVPFPTVGVKIKVSDRSAPVTVWLVHAPGPHFDHNLAMRRTYVDALAKAMQTEGTVLVGDLNMSPWASDYRAAMRRWKLKSGAEGFGLHPTWLASESPIVGALFWSTIDHVLHSGDLQMEEYQVLPSIGSDHRPLFASLLIPRELREHVLPIPNHEHVDGN